MDHADTNFASDDLEEILAAAHERRTDLLLVKGGQDVFGCFDPEKRTIQYFHEIKLEFDLVEQAIEECISHGGEACTVDDKLSSPSPMHALVRYW